MINPKLITGTIELEAQTVTVLSKAMELPFPLDTDGKDINEEIRLKYRYLDLRRERMQKNIRLRSKVVNLMREYLFKNDFVEIETPLLTKSTPEGSRDFLVPSRLQKGEFYALPQSPQQYKQLLMVAGFERYFQVARCMRDEDLRADRGFEHTQLDIEMSFVKREDVMGLIEPMVTEIVEKMGGVIQKKPFPIFTYDQAMKQFKADKFDLRSDEEKKQGINAFAWVVDFPFFEKDKDGKWTYTHNPFSGMPEEQKEAFMKGQIEGIATLQYDLVWNGYEAGGGSIRSNDPAVLQKVFEVLGHSKEAIGEKFGHMLTAFQYGAPPHGGIALGIDRFLMGLTGETSIKEVQAFPQTSSGQTSVMDAPSAVAEEQLAELGLSLKKKK
jgi:aspartyl-tRNA synthetase